MSGGKVVVVTGATRGIGRALANELTRRGHIVYGLGRSWEKQNQAGVKFKPITADICDGDSIKAAIDSVYKENGRIDVLVNNAGISQNGPMEETSIETARNIFETNYFGPTRLIQAALPIMRAQKSGAIVNIGSAAGKIGLPFQAHYSASKFAIEGLSESLMHELKPLGIRVVLIEPGDVGTTIWKQTPATQSENSAYASALAKFRAVKEKEMGQNPDPPEKVAKQIADVIESDDKKFRRPVAKGSKFILIARKILPDSIFLPLVGKNYGVPPK